MSFTAYEYCNMYLALGAAENDAAFTARTYAMRFPNGRHRSY
jgi:hypothetical protein